MTTREEPPANALGSSYQSLFAFLHSGSTLDVSANPRPPAANSA